MYCAIFVLFPQQIAINFFWALLSKFFHIQGGLVLVTKFGVVCLNNTQRFKIWTESRNVIPWQTAERRGGRHSRIKLPSHHHHHHHHYEWGQKCVRRCVQSNPCANAQWERPPQFTLARCFWSLTCGSVHRCEKHESWNPAAERTRQTKAPRRAEPLGWAQLFPLHTHKIMNTLPIIAALLYTAFLSPPLIAHSFAVEAEECALCKQSCS